MVIPLDIYIAWKRRICDNSALTHERIFLGCLVLLTCGLRWMGLQSCSLASLILIDQVLRGECWASKMSRSGMPWAVIATGISGRPPAWSWAQYWFELLASFISKLVDTAGEHIFIDFICPDVSFNENGGSTMRPSPMSYTDALAYSRKLLQSPWLGTSALSAEQAQRYTLHFKASSGSWARQAGIDEPDRMELLHHQPKGGGASARLYSRDDVFGARRAQRQITELAAEGWCPVTPQARGAVPPRIERVVPLARQPINWDMSPEPPFGTCCIAVRAHEDDADPWGKADELARQLMQVHQMRCSEWQSSQGQPSFRAALMTTDLALDLSSSDAGSLELALSDSGDSSTQSDVAAPRIRPNVCFVSVLLTGITHVGRKGDASRGNKTIEFDEPGGGVTYISTLCGSSLAISPEYFQVGDLPPPATVACKRKACRTFQSH